MTDKSATPLTDAVPVSMLDGKHYEDVKRLLLHARRMERDRAILREALRDIEMETRPLGQWGSGEINEVARAALAATEEKP